MSLPTKQEITEKLLEYPLLRQLFFERWFRVAFAAFSCIFIFMALFLPKIWRTSDRGFLPIIKVSGLDLVQAWSLKRTAVKAAAAGRFDEANYAWQAALANNRADPKLVRGALLNVLQDPHRRQLAGQAVQECFWLLKLTKTNLVDLELATRVLEQYRFYDQVLLLLEPKAEELTAPLAAAYLKAVFSSGRIKDFDTLWTKLHQKAGSDPEIPLYRAAYLAGWGPPGTISQARDQIEAATANPGLRVLAYRLKLVLSAHATNPAEYGQVLHKLEDLHEDMFNDHSGYWRVLFMAGKKEEAAQLAVNYPRPPTTPMEAVELAQIYARLELRDQALQIFQRYAGEFGHASHFWVNYAEHLMEAKRWEDLRNIALQIRSEDAVRDQLSAYSYFLEGRAELSLGREANAVAAFQRAAEREFPSAFLGHRVAGQLLQLGQPTLARQVLAGLEQQLQGEVEYWVLVFRAADQLKDVDLLLKAATKAYQLNPQNPVVVNNYAAALIITRQSPQEAIKVTLPFLAQNPNSLHALVNHSAALLLNDRPKEAQALLSRIRTNALDRTQMALYNLDLFETYCGLGEFDRAWRTSDKIEADRLYPSQRRWLEQKRQQLPPRQKSG